MQRQDMLKKLAEFDEGEQIMRRIYFSTVGKQIAIPQSTESIDEIIASVSQSMPEITAIILNHEVGQVLLDEDSFMETGMDAAVVKHGRYTPAFIHSHTFIEVLFVLEGHCVHSTGEISFEMKKGDICLVAPNVRHSVSIFDDESIAINILVRRSNFDTVFFELLTEDDIIANFFTRIIYAGNKQMPYILFHSGDDESVRDIALDMLGEFESDRRYKSRMINALMVLFFTTLLRNHSKDVSIVNPVINKMDDRIILMMKYIENNFNSVTLAHVAGFFNYSEEHLSRMIKEYTGHTFREILRDIKVRKAAELVKKPSIPISEIIIKAGYSDISHFYRNFKEVYGMTPKEYRRKIGVKS